MAEPPAGEYNVRTKPPAPVAIATRENAARLADRHPQKRITMKPTREFKDAVVRRRCAVDREWPGPRPEGVDT